MSDSDNIGFEILPSLKFIDMDYAKDNALMGISKGNMQTFLSTLRIATYIFSPYSVGTLEITYYITQYTIQCVLPLNMFLEKIFIFLWFWHCILGLITIVSILEWFTRMGFSRNRLKFIRKYLKIMAVISDSDKPATKKFVENFLRPDGVFLIRLISVNIGDLMAGDLACELWHIYRHHRLRDAEELKYIEPMSKLSDYLASDQQQHSHVINMLPEEFGMISHPERDKLLISMNNGTDDSIV